MLLKTFSNMHIHEIVQNTIDVNVFPKDSFHFLEVCTARPIVQSNGAEGTLNVRTLHRQVSGLVPSKRNWVNVR